MSSDAIALPPDLVHVVQQIQQPSFPSGHTLHYTVFYGFLFFVIATNFKSSWMRNIALVICALLVLLVGPSRVYLGEHWPTDVLGGYLSRRPVPGAADRWLSLGKGASHGDSFVSVDSPDPPSRRAVRERAVTRGQPRTSREACTLRMVSR